jgi:hypothetical protein
VLVKSTSDSGRRSARIPSRFRQERANSSTAAIREQAGRASWEADDGPMDWTRLVSTLRLLGLKLRHLWPMRIEA